MIWRTSKKRLKALETKSLQDGVILTEARAAALEKAKREKVAFAKLSDRKTPVTAADLLNDRVLPFFEEHEVSLLRMLADRGTESRGNPEHHEYELSLALEDIDHTRTKAHSPQTNGICERFHKTVLNEFYPVMFRKKLYKSIEELQVDLDQAVQRGRNSPGAMVLWENPDRDFHR